MLRGESNCGKSETLRMVYDELIKDKAKIISPKSVLGNEKQGDFECLLDYKGEILAFYTMGDYSTAVVEAFSTYKDKCDVLICACNTKFKRPICIVKLKYAGCSSIIDKTKSLNRADFAKENAMYCNKVINELKNKAL